MIALIIKSYLTILISVGCGSLLLFILGVYCIVKAVAQPAQKNRPQAAQERAQKIAKNVIIADPDDTQDFRAIAGDDVFATKLDLARAFIETGNINSAKTILMGVSKHGNADQQQEAQRLLQLT